MTMTTTKTAVKGGRTAARNIETKTDHKMVWFKIGFWTDFKDHNKDRLEGRPAKVGKYWRAPKNIWDNGVIRILQNDFQKLVKRTPIPFNTLEELVPKLIAELVRQGVTVHRGRKTVSDFSKLTY